MEEKRKLIVGLGSNLGNRKENLERALFLLKQEFGNEPIVSSWYETEPWGFETEHLFLNACAYLYTHHSPTTVLAITQEIEKKIGRTQKTKEGNYQSRKIDIDILYLGDIVCCEKNLTIPHPRLYERKFVLLPLHEICPYFVDPKTKQNINEILRECREARCEENINIEKNR